MHGIVQSSLLCLIFIWTAVSLTSLVHSTSYVHHVEVSTKGHDNTSCLNSSFPCKTLGYVLENLKNSTQVSIRSGNYTLDKNYNISYLQNLAFKGPNRSVKIQCSSEHEVGLQFRFCNSVVFEQLEFEGCGRLEYSAPFHLNSSRIYKFYSGISLTYCKDLDIKNCTFAKSAGIALLLYDVGGNVSVVDSDFVYNTGKNQSKSLDVHKTGSGVLLHLTQFGSLYPFYDTIHRLFSNGNNYIFKGCRFALNGYKVKDKSQRTPQPFGHGSGLTVFLCGSAKNNSLLIDTCQFQNNTAIWGGGVFMEFHDKAEGNALRMIGSEFTGNYAEIGGGAVRTGNNIQGNESLQQMENTVDYERNTFFSNYAALGGAVSHFGQTYPHIFGECKNSIRFANCTFKNNTATMGSAIAVALNNKNNWIEMGPEIPYCTEISDCKIENNLVKQPKNNKENDHVVGMGVVYSSKVPLILRGYNIFTENNNTALLLDNAPLKVFNNTLFMKNFGYKGGALALYGQARLIMTKGSHLNFTNNLANEKGGALFIRTPGPEVAPFKTRELRRHECPIGYEDEKGKLVSLDYVEHWDTHIDFMNNSAPLWGGFSLYATTLQSCYLANESIGNNTAFQWENIFTYSFSNIRKEISTDPVKISFKKQEWSVAPDEAFDPMIELLDEKDSTVYGIVKIQIIGSGYTPSLFPESLFLVQSDGSSSPSGIHGLRLRGVERYNFTLTISSVGGQVISNSFTQQFKNCYDGFEQKDKKRGVCSCMSDTVDMHEGVFNCTTDGKHVNLKTGYWGGQVTKGKFVTYPCPQHYCNFDENKLFYIYDKSNICAGNRNSSVLLCGKCKNNFTLSLGGEKCVKTSLCGNNFSILWGIPVFVVVTPLVILILLRINVDIFTSYLNSWLYFYQVLPFVLKVETMMKLDPAMQGILDLASWKLPGVQLHCFVKNLDNIGKLGFNYLMPLYMLAILIIISLAARCCCNCYQRTNVFRAISSILVLCYTNLTMISFNVVHWVKFQKDLSVLYVEGSITSDNIPGSYYALLVLAIIIIICFVIVFPILLLFRPFFIRNFHFMNYFTQLYNIFQHCFQDHLGFFSAYYFICRIALLVLAAALSTPGPYKRCWTEILVFLTLAIFVYVQPYRTDSHLKWLNTVDTIILSILCLMAFMSSAQNTEAAPKTIHGVQVCVMILSWLPMIYLAGLIIIAIRHYCKQYFPSREGYQNLDDPTSTSGT